MDPWRSVHAARIRAYLSSAPQDSRNLDSAESATPNRGHILALVLRGPWPQERQPEPRMRDR